MGAATIALGAVGAPSQLWQLLPGLGAALALWATGARVSVTNEERQGDTMKWSRFAHIMMELIVVGAVFVAGFLINGATMGIALGSGVGVAILAAEGTTRCWPHRAHHPRSG